MEIMDFISLAVALVGAGAWIPLLVDKFRNRKISIYGAFLDIASIQNFKLRDPSGQMKTGFLIIFAVDFCVEYNPFYITDCSIVIKFAQDAASYKGTVCYSVKFFDRDKNDERIPMMFDFPEQFCITRKRYLIPEEQNIRIIPCWLDRDSNNHPIKQSDIESVEITLKGRGRVKKGVIIGVKDAPLRDKGLISKYKKCR